MPPTPCAHPWSRLQLRDGYVVCDCGRPITDPTVLFRAATERLNDVQKDIEKIQSALFKLGFDSCIKCGEFSLTKQRHTYVQLAGETYCLPCAGRHLRTRSFGTEVTDHLRTISTSLAHWCARTRASSRASPPDLREVHNAALCSLPGYEDAYALALRQLP